AQDLPVGRELPKPAQWMEPGGFGGLDLDEGRGCQEVLQRSMAQVRVVNASLARGPRRIGEADATATTSQQPSG
ncbi:MAG TPA: hypothetical protein VF972_05145, partial [Actinomycetota bacterium]